MAQESIHNRPLFQDIHADTAETDVTEIESLCLQCEKNGTTKIMLTRIPFFNEVILSSFECPHCHFSNSEMEPAGKICEKGTRVSLIVRTSRDLNRQLVKMKWASLRIPEIDFEYAEGSQKGLLTTVEGVLEHAVTGLAVALAARQKAEGAAAVEGAAVVEGAAAAASEGAEMTERLAEFITRLQGLREEAAMPWTLLMDDPSGNSFIENPEAPRKDPALKVSYYVRTRAQDALLGLVADDEGDAGRQGSPAPHAAEDIDHADKIENDEVLTFAANCPNCNAPVQTKMKPVDVPHFKEVIIMATDCPACGHRSNEVKAGSGVEPLGRRHTLTLSEPEDLSRDVLKSETCAVKIPCLDFEHETWVSGGKFTTVEGLLVDIKEQLVEKNPFYRGDSSNEHMAERLQEFGKQLDAIITGKMKDVVIILDDPAGNSYLQDIYSPEPDPRLNVESYERTFQQNDDLGLNDMKTENYTNE